MTTEPKKPKFNLTTLSDDQVRELFHHLCEARLILQQDCTFFECFENEDRHYYEMWGMVCDIESEVFDEHLKREACRFGQRSNLNNK